jgi:hypothetical protein
MDSHTFTPGDIVRENRQGAQPETVLDVRGNILYTTAGALHVTKAVRVSASGAR